MLLMLNEKEEALQKALSCGDTDLGIRKFSLRFYFFLIFF
jgi:hypothetical protein